MPQPASPSQVLFLCTANVCRSRAAEAVTRTCSHHASPTVASAGTMTVPGLDHDPVMEAALTDAGIPLDAHHPVQASGRLLARQDLIVVFSPEHLAWVAGERPDLLARTIAIGQLLRSAPTPGTSLPALLRQLPALSDGDWLADPYGHGAEAARQTVRILATGLRQVWPALTND